MNQLPSLRKSISRPNLSGSIKHAFCIFACITLLFFYFRDVFQYAGKSHDGSLVTAAVFMRDPLNTRSVMLNADYKTATLFTYIFQCYDILVSNKKVQEYVTAKQVKDFNEIVAEHVLLHNAAEVTKHYQKAAKARLKSAVQSSSGSSSSGSSSSSSSSSSSTVNDMSSGFNITDLQVVDSDSKESYEEVTSDSVGFTFMENAFEELIKSKFDDNPSDMIVDIMAYMSSPKRQAGEPSHPQYVNDIQDGLLKTIFTVLKEDGSEKGVSTARKSLTMAANVILSDDFLLFITGKLISIGNTCE